MDNFPGLNRNVNAKGSGKCSGAFLKGLLIFPLANYTIELLILLPYRLYLNTYYQPGNKLDRFEIVLLRSESRVYTTSGVLYISDPTLYTHNMFSLIALLQLKLTLTLNI